ncbi:MAG: hypothetical protein R3C20_02775 [Planctomycetaceae bacterium]
MANQREAPVLCTDTLCSFRWLHIRSEGRGLTEPNKVCSLHRSPLQTEEKPAWYGTVSYVEPFDFEDYNRFPYANDMPVALRDREYEFVESAKISYCPECRRIKDAERLQNSKPLPSQLSDD